MFHCRNYFTSGGFLDPKRDECDRAWNLLREGITFEVHSFEVSQFKYKNWYTELMTSELFRVDELIEDNLSGINLRDHEEKC